MDVILEYFEYVKNQLAGIGVIDVIDILIVALLFYYTFRFVRERRAGKLLVGIIILIGMLLLSSLLHMRALNFLLTNLFSVGLIAIVIVFQPELRSALEKVGGESIRNFKGMMDADTEYAVRNAIGEVCVAAESFSESKTGALIVFERGTKLGDYIRTGTVVDAVTSSFLLGNIFFNKAPLHDGAVILSHGRVTAAACILPLAVAKGQNFGTRHRAALGITEESDAIALVVSEERGEISLAVRGTLTRHLEPAQLRAKLNDVL